MPNKVEDKGLLNTMSLLPSLRSFLPSLSSFVSIVVVIVDEVAGRNKSSITINLQDPS
jgi:hypothetical protein